MALDEERHSKALEIELISDPEQKARQEAENGRTSRVVSYLVLCVRLGYVLPGTTTIPDPYYQALEAADKANASGKLDLTEMELLLESLLANQLVSVLDSARSGT
jgi:hypothetical protein